MKIFLTIALKIVPIFTFAQLHPIPAGEYRAFSLLNDTTETPLLNFGFFEISNEVTFEEYRFFFLNEIRSDSIFDLTKCLLDNDALPREAYQMFLYDPKFGDRSVVGVSWEGAMEYCRWKTLEELETSDTLSHIYRLPTLSEWLYASAYSDSLNNLLNFHDGVSEWILNAKDESRYPYDPSRPDYIYNSQPGDPASVRRKMVIGNSPIMQYDHLIRHTNLSYYEFNGYSYVGFRFVRIPITKKPFSKNELGLHSDEYWLLKKWGLSK